MESKKCFYECMFVIDPRIDEVKREALIKQFSGMAGPNTATEKLGQKKLGFYVLLNFSSEPDLPAKMNNLMGITEGIVRRLFITKNEVMLSQDIIRKQNRLKAREEYAAKKAAAVNAAAEEGE
jgi:small subunit ribosomal protein S6